MEMEECEQCRFDRWCYDCQMEFYDYLKDAEPEYYEQKFQGESHWDIRFDSYFGVNCLSLQEGHGRQLRNNSGE